MNDYMPETRLDARPDPRPDPRPEDNAPKTALEALTEAVEAAPEGDQAATPATAPGDWPEAWRALLADGDQRLEKRLGRFASPRNVLDSLLAAELRLRGGNSMADARPGDDDPAGLAAWRAAQGVPEAPEDYSPELPDGMVIGEDDTPVVDAFLKAAHGANMSREQVNNALAWYYSEQDRIAAERHAVDMEAHDTAVDLLKQTWGEDYRAQVNVVHSLFDDAPEDLKDNLLGARLADGRILGDHSDAIQWLARLAMDRNPRATLMPAAASGPGKALADEISTIEKRMATDRSGYFKDEPQQARYRALLEARDGGR